VVSLVSETNITLIRYGRINIDNEMHSDTPQLLHIDKFLRSHEVWSNGLSLLQFVKCFHQYVLTEDDQSRKTVSTAKVTREEFREVLRQIERSIGLEESEVERMQRHQVADGS
jgi:hypothetical protein